MTKDRKSAIVADHELSAIARAIINNLGPSFGPQGILNLGTLLIVRIIDIGINEEDQLDAAKAAGETIAENFEPKVKKLRRALSTE